MSLDFFLDTNILVYAHDTSDPLKRGKAQNLITGGLQRGDTAISAQVLSEFFVTATRKLAPPLPVAIVEQEIILLSHLFVVAVDAPLITAAIGLLNRYSLSYWDSLILAAALEAGCKTVYSEDMAHGQHYGATQVLNPFL